MAEPIRILHMIGSLNIGGSQSVVINLYKNIDRSKIQFDFIIDHPNETFYKEYVDSLGARIFEMPTFTGINIIQVKKAWNRFFQEHPEYRILHSHVRSYASIYIPIAQKYGLKTIIHSHSTSNGKGIKSIIKAIMQYPLRNQADYFIGCSEEAGKWLFGSKVVKSDRYFTLKNAIDLSKYVFDQNIRLEYRSQLGLANEITYIHVGRFHPSKNHRFLIDLFAKIHEYNRNTKLVIVGDGQLRPQIESQISNLHLENSIILTGNRTDIPNLLFAADCFLFPSNWEGLPVTVVEAQAAGLPCLVSDRVTEEVAISGLVHFLPIYSGMECWLDAIKSMNYVKIYVHPEIQKSGFDISLTAGWLLHFYESIW